MNNRKTTVVSVRLDKWMVQAIDELAGSHDTRTDVLKAIVDEVLRKKGLTPAIMRSRHTDPVQESMDRRN